MTCVGGTENEGPTPASCYVVYASIVLGAVISLVGAFAPQLSGGAYVLRWGAFMGGLLPYLVIGAFLPMRNSLWLAFTAVAVVVIDIGVRVGTADLTDLPFGGYQPLALALAAAVVLGIGLLVSRRGKPETPRAVQSESASEAPKAEDRKEGD